MGILNKILIGTAVFVAALLLVSMAEAASGVSVADLDVYYDGISYEGVLDLENAGSENVTAVVGIYTDGNRTVGLEVDLNINYFQGFKLKSVEHIYFDVPGDKGFHEVTAVVLIGRTTIIETFVYEAYGYSDEEKEEEEEINVEDWLGCP